MKKIENIVDGVEVKAVEQNDLPKSTKEETPKPKQVHQPEDENPQKAAPQQLLVEANIEILS